MSKRRINKQQTARIKKNQQTYQNPTTVGLNDGLVITRFSRHVEVEDEQGTRTRCSIRPNLETLVAGDRIIWQAEGDNQGVVVSLYPRETVLSRPTASGQKPVAANISQMIIVIAAKPEVSWPLLDSYLVMAHLLNLNAVILANKTDLPCEQLIDGIKDYQQLGYPVLVTNQHDKNSLTAIEHILNEHTSVFVGQSGVGKSSLISRVLPHESNIAINQISTISELGRHTTSNSRYYHIPTGGALIDSPGVREFSLWSITPAMLINGYPEFKPYLNSCKFRNCTHEKTPYCAILTALDCGLITRRRYDNFLKLRAQFSKT